MSIIDREQRARVLADYRAAVATTKRLCAEINDSIHRLQIAIRHRESAAVALERLPKEEQ